MPAVCKSAALISAVNCVLRMKVVGLSISFQRTIDPAIKFVPVIVSVNPAQPARASLWLRLSRTGAGLVIVKLRALEISLCVGFDTVTLTTPADAMLDALIWAVSCVLLISVVDKGTPFQRTSAPASKPVPSTVRVSCALPAIAVLGLRLAIMGVGSATGCSYFSRRRFAISAI